MTNEEKLTSSLSFISQNPKALSNEVPSELLEFWIVENDDIIKTMESIETPEKSPEFTIFLYAYLLFQKNKGIETFSTRPEELQEAFTTFQLLINMAFVSNNTDISTEPFPLFNFDDSAEIKFELTF